MKTWIRNRLNWMDNEWGNKCVMTGIEENDALYPPNLRSVTLGIYPNPSDFSGLNVLIKTPVNLNKALL